MSKQNTGQEYKQLPACVGVVHQLENSMDWLEHGMVVVYGMDGTVVVYRKLRRKL